MSSPMREWECILSSISHGASGHFQGRAFDTAGFIGLMVPLVGLSCLIVFQCAARENCLSALANVLALMVMLGWFLAVWSIVVEASAAV